jgi:butyrate kinase
LKTIKIVAINLGTTSTKIAYSENGQIKVRETLSHPAEELVKMRRFWDQEGLRKAAIEGFLAANTIRVEELDAFVAWGGHTEPVTGGVYRITPKLLEQSSSEKYGYHVADLAPRLAHAFAQRGPQAFVVDPPTIDEFNPLARYSGIPEIARQSRCQALNQKGNAKKYAREIGKKYEELRLIVVVMGGGISVVVHEYGRMVDANNGLDGDGPFSTNRSGGLPVGAVIDLCYSGRYTHTEMRKKINGSGGLLAYLGEFDVRKVEERIRQGDATAAEVLNAMIYQTAKEVGGAAAVLSGRVDAIVLAGGMANSTYIVDRLRERIGFIAPVVVYPGELEMESLCLSVYQALIGEEKIKEL